jgi:hypothetical protein
LNKSGNSAPSQDNSSTTSSNPNIVKLEQFGGEVFIDRERKLIVK